MSNIVFDKDQQNFLDLAEKGDNLFVTGEGGSGKSFVVNHFIQKHSRVAVLAPTGIAALNVGGSTVHRFFKLSPKFQDLNLVYSKFASQLRKPEEHRKEEIQIAIETIQQTNTLVIDELGMLRSDVFNAIDVGCKTIMNDFDTPFGGIQIIGVGDPYQLPPVVTNDDRQYFLEAGSEWFFNSAAWHYGQFKILELKTGHRFKAKDADEEAVKEAEAYRDLLNAMRKGRISNEQLQLINTRVQPRPADYQGVCLTSTNRAAFEINKQMLDSLPGRATCFESSRSGDTSNANMGIEDKLFLKEGARIMFINNDKEARWVNGSLGTVTVIRKNELEIDIDDYGIETVKKHTFELKDYMPPKDGTKRFEIELLKDAKGKKKGEVGMLECRYSTDGALILRQLEFFGREASVVGKEFKEGVHYTKVKEIPAGELELEVVGSVAQFPIRLSWAMTIHKSQGKTLEQAHIDLGKRAFAPGMAYVANSRVTSLKGVTLERPMTHRDIWACPHVLRFMEMAL